MKIDLNAMTRRFLLGEGAKRPTLRAYVETVVRILDEIRPKSQKEDRKISMARQHLLEIKSLTRVLENQIIKLEEQVKLLEEGK
tara:strand:+ start:2712 stop:2963 length:252 start_codon:yes stop_codon:yes gene_type:complete